MDREVGETGRSGENSYRLSIESRTAQLPDHGCRQILIVKQSFKVINIIKCITFLSRTLPLLRAPSCLPVL